MFTLMQIILITLIWVLYKIAFEFNILSPYGNSVLLGWLVGLVLGDVPTGLLIGGTMELMGIGMNPLGGASVPNYQIGTIVGATFAIATGQGMDVGIAVGVPVGILSINVEIFGRMLGTALFHKTLSANEKMDFHQMNLTIVGALILNVIVSAIPIVLVLLGGSAIIEALIAVLPTWLMNGLSAAGNVLPAVGFAVLLNCLPLKGTYIYLILGYCLAAYLGAPVLCVALVAFVIAIAQYNRSKETEVQGGIEYDE